MLQLATTPDNSRSGPLIGELALAARLPSLSSSRRHADDGVLMAYGPNLNEIFGSGGAYVGRILNGEQVADLPVLAPSIYDLVLNLRTAHAIGFTFPVSFLAVANEVIE